MTHMTVAYLVKRVVSPRRNMLAFVAGATLPDLVTYVPLFMVGVGMSLQRAGFLDLQALPVWVSNLPCLFAPFHGIVPFFLLCWLLVLFFPVEKRKGIFGNLVLGAGLHFLMDLAQVSHNPGGYLLFPLTREDYSLEWFGSEASLYVVPVLMAVAAVVLIRDILRDRNARARPENA